jgi:hypothetical protein
MTQSARSKIGCGIVTPRILVPYRALARRVEGSVLLARGRHDDTLRAFDRALAQLTRIGSRLEAARAFYHRARVGLASGQIAAGRRDAFEARDAFAAIGAVHDRASGTIAGERACAVMPFRSRSR